MFKQIEQLRSNGSVHEKLLRAEATIPGWTPVEQLLALYSAVIFSSPAIGDVVEIGAWCGRSTVALGLAAREMGCRVFSADIFPTREDWIQNSDGTWSISTTIDHETVLACQSHTVWHQAFVNDILPIYKNGRSPRQHLDEALTRFGLHDVVAVHRATGAGLRMTQPDLSIRLLFLDGDHDEAAVRDDINGFLPLMSPNGLLCFDDAFTVYDGIDNAIVRNLLMRNPPVISYGSKITRKMYVARVIT